MGSTIDRIREEALGRVLQMAQIDWEKGGWEGLYRGGNVSNYDFNPHTQNPSHKPEKVRSHTNEAYRTLSMTTEHCTFGVSSQVKTRDYSCCVGPANWI